MSAVVGYVELRASFPIYKGEISYEEDAMDANDVLDVLLDRDGLEGVLSDAVDHGSTVLTVQYRGDEMSHRSPM